MSNETCQGRSSVRGTSDTTPDTQASTQPAAEAAGQQQPAAGAARPSYGDLLTAPLTKRFAKFSAGVYAAVATGAAVQSLATVWTDRSLA